MIDVHQFQFNAFQENTYVLSDSKNNCVIIDPGCYTRQEEQHLKDFIASNRFEPKALLNTHAHIDHVLGNAFVLAEYDIPFFLHEKDLKALHSVASYAHVYGFEQYKPSPNPTKALNHLDQLSFGDIHLEVLFTPGHSPGHVVFYSQKENFVINGDVLFQGSFGRVDLPGGDLETLKNSIYSVMFNMPKETVVYCGHGPKTTIGVETESNYINQF